LGLWRKVYFFKNERYSILDFIFSKNKVHFYVEKLDINGDEKFKNTENILLFASNKRIILSFHWRGLSEYR